MARRTHDDALGVAGAETVIGTGVVVNGNLASQSDIAVDGTLTGNIQTEGDVTVGMNANIKGNVTGTNIMVAGIVHGNVTASGETSIRETGSVTGDIKATSLAVSSGGTFVGRSIMDAPPTLDGDQPEGEPETAEEPGHKNHKA